MTTPFTRPTSPSTPSHYPPTRTALLLLDFHTFFISHPSASAATASALSTATQMRTWAKSKGIPIIHALVDVHARPFPTCKDPQRLLAVVETARASGLAAEPPELTTEEEGIEEKTFTRAPGYVSALRSPGLVEYLHGKGVRSLILCGLSTSGCVLRTAMAATDAEFVVTVVEDACADPGEGVHEFVVGRLLGNRAWVVRSGELREGYEGVYGGA